MKGLTHLIGLCSTMSWVMGWAFGIMQWPGARELSVYGFLAFAFIFLPLLAISSYKIKQKGSQQLQHITGFASGWIIGLSIAFKTMHLLGADILFLVGSFILVFGFLPVFFFNLYRQEN